MVGECFCAPLNDADIADVTHFVEEGSPLDVEASQRSTTVYLIDRRLDMLPAELSSDIPFLAIEFAYSPYSIRATSHHCCRPP